jgi:hypothetical protein
MTTSWTGGHDFLQKVKVIVCNLSDKRLLKITKSSKMRLLKNVKMDL